MNLLIVMNKQKMIPKKYSQTIPFLTVLLSIVNTCPRFPLTMLYVTTWFVPSSASVAFSLMMFTPWVTGPSTKVVVEDGGLKTGALSFSSRTRIRALV